MYSNRTFKMTNSSANRIQDTIDEFGVFGGEGLYYIDKPIRITQEQNALLGRLGGKRGFYLYTDKPINLIELEPDWKGGNRYLRGVEVNNVTLQHFGNEEGNYSGIKIMGSGKEEPNVFKNNNLDFDYYGNKIANAVTVDWQNCRWGASFYTTDIKGFWYDVNVGFHSVKKEPFLHDNGRLYPDWSNTLDLDVKIWGAKTYFDIQGMNFLKLNMLGEDQRGNPYKEDLLFNFKGANIEWSVFVYDTRGRKGKIDLTTKDGFGHIKPFGYATRKGYTQIQAKEVIGFKDYSV